MIEITSADELSSPLDRIRYRPQARNDAEGRIASAILLDPPRACRESITSLSERAGVSLGSVVRFSRLMGYNGFRELKLALAADIPRSRASGGTEATPSTFRARMDLQVRALVFAAQAVDSNAVEEAALLIARARNIDIVAAGDSAAIALSLSFWLTSQGFHCRHLSDPSEQAAAAGFLAAEDALIAISFSGRTRSVVQAASRAAENGVPVIGLTCSDRSQLSRQATVIIAADAVRAGLSSAEWPVRTALLAVSRALALSVGDRASEAEAGRRRAVWASGRFGLRHT